MKKLVGRCSQILFLLTMIVCSNKSFCQSTGEEILGIWSNQEKAGHIEIYRSGETYSGKLTWMKTPKDPVTGQLLLDTKNPDDRLRNKPLLGSTLMYGFTFSKDSKEWVNGKIYDGRKGKTYKCRLTLQDANTLLVYGYIGASWMKLGETNTWSRLQ
jgi:uncharacterized protein (DUF2147 family)